MTTEQKYKNVQYWDAINAIDFADRIFLFHLNVTNHHRDKKWTNRLTNTKPGELHMMARSDEINPVQGWRLGVRAVDTDEGGVCPVKLSGISNGGLVILSDQPPPTWRGLSLLNIIFINHAEIQTLVGLRRGESHQVCSWSVNPFIHFWFLLLTSIASFPFLRSMF